MGEFSFVAWLIVLAIFGSPVWLIVRWLQRRRKQPDAQLVGIDGWLAFLAFLLCLGFLRSLGEFVKGFEYVPQLMNVPAARLPTILGLAIAAVVLALQLWAIVALFLKRKYFKRLFLGLWIANGLMVVPPLLMLTVPGVTIDHMADALGAVVGTFIGFGLWVWYTRVSVRVRNTMVT